MMSCFDFCFVNLCKGIRPRSYSFVKALYPIQIVVGANIRFHTAHFMSKAISYPTHVFKLFVIVIKVDCIFPTKSRDADACAGRFSNTQYLSTPSNTTSKLKRGVFNFEVENNTRHFINSAIGYFKGFGSMLVNSVVPLGLGLGALFGKGKWAKGSAIGLGIYAGVKFFKDVLGFGHYNDLNRKF